MANPRTHARARSFPLRRRAPSVATLQSGCVSLGFHRQAGDAAVCVAGVEHIGSGAKGARGPRFHYNRAALAEKRKERKMQTVKIERTKWRDGSEVCVKKQGWGILPVINKIVGPLFLVRKQGARTRFDCT